MNFFEHHLTDPWAPHPVVNSRNICSGGGGGGGTPQPPDMSGYIAEMSKIGARGQERSTELYDWAKEHGVQLDQLGKAVSERAGTMADSSAERGERLMANWEKTYQPLYDAQAADASRMISNLPGTEEKYAGKYAADTAQAFDAAKSQQQRQLQSYGLKAPSIGSAALDQTAANQRAAATVAANESGRLAARSEARGVTQNALQSGLALPQVGGQSSNLALAAGNQQINAPESAISTTAGAMQPGLGYYSAALPYMKTWGDTMQKSYEQQLAASKQSEDSGGGFGAILGTGLGIAGSVAGSYFGGPMGASIGGKLGSMAGSAAGSGSLFAEGGQVEGGDNFVDPGMSPSEGAITDDVPARLNAGEFVFPKDVVAWRGEQWAHKEIMKARQEREKVTQQSGAEPEMGPPEGSQEMAADEMARGGAIHTMPPTPAFVSEGARA